MARFRRLRPISAAIAKVVVGVVAVVLILVGLGLLAIETEWGKTRIRDLLVRQANQYLTATLDIGRLGGSLLRGIDLYDVRLTQNGRTLVRIDELTVSYSLRELIQQGTVIRRLRLVRPQIDASRLPDGRWDLGAIVKEQARQQQRAGPSRPIAIESIEIVDGRVSLHAPLDFGAAHAPTDFRSLNAALSFSYQPVQWRLAFDRVSWIGHAPELTVTRLSGGFGRGPDGWRFEGFRVETPRSAFTLDGRIDAESHPTVLHLKVHADPFAFQEWSGVLHGLADIGVQAAFDVSLDGPVTAMATNLRLSGTGGSVVGPLTIDTSVPGWHAAGSVEVARLNLARWMSDPERVSDITGRVTFNLDLELGRHFPRGTYAFRGPHAMFMQYGADDLDAHGQITNTRVLIAGAQAVAYGAPVTVTGGWIELARPFPFQFSGRASTVDLRRVPKALPVPHVESVLAFSYEISGRFHDPIVIGSAKFQPSTFLGAAIGAGTVGSIDTSATPFRYSGDGEIDGVDLHQFGVGLDVGWLRDPRYAGTVSGRFHVEGAGSDRATLALTARGRLVHANLFQGVLQDADVSLAIENGTLSAAYDGRLAGINPAVPFDQPRLAASLTGSARVSATVRDLLTAEKTTWADYDVTGRLTLGPSLVHDIHVDRSQLDASLRQARVTVTDLRVFGPSLEGQASGTIALEDPGTSDVQFDVAHADLAALSPLSARGVTGRLTTKGRLAGPSSAIHATGEATLDQLSAEGLTAVSLTGRYDVTAPADDPAAAQGTIDGRASMLDAFGVSLTEAAGTVTYAAPRLGFDLRLSRPDRSGSVSGAVLVHPEQRTLTVAEFAAALGGTTWRLAPTPVPAAVSWSERGVDASPIAIVAEGRGRIGVSGTWRVDGSGALRITASQVFLDTFQAASGPARYGGVLDLDATLRGTRERPQIDATVSVAQGRVERVSYQSLSGRVKYADRTFDIDLRLDQSAGVWLTATGSVPLALFESGLPEQPIHVAIASSPINLGLLAGVTDVVRDVTGELQLDVTAVGTTRDPHFAGSVSVGDAGFLVASTGVRYKNGRASIGLARERITVEALHLEDGNGRPLDVRGSLATHELKVGDFEIDVTANRFEVLRNAIGRVSIDATARLSGRFEEPRLAGTVTIDSGNLQVDEILERTAFRPYATQPVSITPIDAVAALNPWDRLGLDLAVHVPENLKLAGSNVQVAPGAPIGLGNVDVRLGGDLYLYKDPAGPLSITGSLDSVSGAFTFQGRRFDVDEAASSINFQGDANPDLYVVVTRAISGVQTRVSVTGLLNQPELQLASNPSLGVSDILSLIVFGTSSSQLSGAQQQELVVRAGALAAGFIAAPLLSSIERELGLDILSIEPPGAFGTGPTVTVGEEIAPGLVARFSRQFGPEPYSEATIEYFLSRILRLRATFSDAQSLTARSPFRRLERAGIDLLFSFSF